MYPYYHFIQTYNHHGRVAVHVEFGLETWMVTEQVEFLELTRDIAMQVASMNPETLQGLLEQPYVKDTSFRVREVLTATSKKLGERVTVTRFLRWENDHPPLPIPPDKPTPPRAPAVIMKFKAGK